MLHLSSSFPDRVGIEQKSAAARGSNHTAFRRWYPITLAILAACVSAIFPAVAFGAQPSAPFSFDELVTMSRPDQLPPSLQAKLDKTLRTPTVQNRPNSAKTIRSRANLVVTEWNIERGARLDAILELLQSPQRFIEDAHQAKKLSRAALKKLPAQIDVLRNSDVLILNEVDLGVKRSDYRNVAKEMADALGMSYAYSVEFLEVDSLTDLGTEPAVLDTAQMSQRMTEDLKPDRKLFRGLHGNAILSRFPLRNVHVISLPVCHDWFADEMQAISKLEKAKRKAADVVFLERMTREVRRGNRHALVADIEIPGVTGQRVRIVNAHLENKCKANCRVSQMKKVLEQVADTNGPLVMAGDLNSTGTDGTPTSIKYELMTRVKDYQFWVGNFLRFTPFGLPVYATAPFAFWKNFRDPTALHIPVIGKNPEARLFSSVRTFQFADGGKFDFGGIPARNRQKSSKTLSDSNQRAGKGFVPTFSMDRTYGGIIQYRLDWIFVKPQQAAGISANLSQAFLPEMPRTMGELNNALSERMSDHAPISVTIPLAAPR